MRVVADTAILVRMSAKASGPARRLLEQIASGPHELVLSPFLLMETERVLSYPRMQALYALSPEGIREHIAELVSVARIVDPVVREPVVLNDPEDDPVIYTAVDGRADVLCTLDGDFYKPGVIEFCRKHGISVVTDVELLRML
jgi:putative PIN family toxin of toxin-antitoxin system